MKSFQEVRSRAPGPGDDQIAKPDINSLTGRVRNLLTERQGLVFPSRESAND